MKKLNRFTSVIEKIVRKHGIEGKYEVSVFSADESEMKKLLDGKVHDVLSFPLDLDTTYPDGIVRLGDIVICESYAKNLGESGEFLVEHGCLHLLGIHHD